MPPLWVRSIKGLTDSPRAFSISPCNSHKHPVFLHACHQTPLQKPYRGLCRPLFVTAVSDTQQMVCRVCTDDLYSMVQANHCGLVAGYAVDSFLEVQELLTHETLDTLAFVCCNCCCCSVQYSRLVLIDRLHTRRCSNRNCSISFAVLASAMQHGYCKHRNTQLAAPSGHTVTAQSNVNDSVYTSALQPLLDIAVYWSDGDNWPQ